MHGWDGWMGVVCECPNNWSQTDERTLQTPTFGDTNGNHKAIVNGLDRVVLRCVHRLVIEHGHEREVVEIARHTRREAVQNIVETPPNQVAHASENNKTNKDAHKNEELRSTIECVWVCAQILRVAEARSTRDRKSMSRNYLKSSEVSAL
jgi:hypothetical protein